MAENYSMEDLLKIMQLLRGPGGCPWDRAQTHQSIRANMLEEAYEAADAIDRMDMDNLKEELGDVLLQVVFHACMAQEAGYFTFDDVVTASAKSWSTATPTSSERWRPGTPMGPCPPGTPRSGRKRASPLPATPWTVWPGRCPP